jgi:hypothetical protein
MSCSIKKIENSKNVSTLKSEQNLTEIELNVVNDFIDVELKSDRYKKYKNYQYTIIEEAWKKSTAIYSYEYSYKNYYDSESDNKNYWILDTLQVKKIQEEIKNEEVYHWKMTDFKNTKVNLLKFEELRHIINTSAYITLPHRLIIFLSKPLIIDKNNAFINFDIGNGDFGNYAIIHFTVLMKKVDDKWVQSGTYDDGVLD